MIASIFIESEKINPSKPGRSSVLITFGLNVAGCFSASIAGSSNVRDHDARGAGGDAAPERRQFHRVETLARMRNDRQAEMRIDVGIAVPGKMLQRREHAGVLEAARKTRDHRAGLGRIFAERSNVDHRIARVVVDVGDRRKVDVHAERARFRADHLAGVIGELRIAGGAKRHRARELGRAGDAHLHAPFEVR